MHSPLVVPPERAFKTANAPHSWADTLLVMPVDITFTMTDDQVARATVVGQLANPDLTNQELKADLEVAAKRGVIRRLREWQRDARRSEYKAAMAADAEEFDAEFDVATPPQAQNE